MAGHSKWANIKHRKGAADARRSKIFTRIIKEITVAAREGLPDPEANPRLRLAVTNAKGANISKDTILRAINKANDKGGQNYQELVYEGYAANGVAVIVETATDNMNRTVANIRSHFSKHGNGLGVNGSVTFMFDRKGIFTIPKGTLDEENFILEMIDSGAEDVEAADDIFIITTALETFGNMQKTLESRNIEPESVKLEYIPQNTITLDIESARKVLKLIDILEEDDDVQNVYHNLEITEELVNIS